MRRPVLAVVAGMLCALLAVAVVSVSGVHAAVDDVFERLGDCQDDEIDGRERVQICSHIIDDASLPEDLRAEALVNRGIVHLEDAKPDLAMADFEQAIAFNPSYPVAHAYRGEAHKAKGQFAKALSDYDTAISLDAASADLYAYRGEIHRRMGALDKARVDYEAALKLEAGHDVAVLGMRALGAKK